MPDKDDHSSKLGQKNDDKPDPAKVKALNEAREAEAKAREAEAKELAEPVDPLSLPGFHVVAGSEFLGTYETEADAEAFISGHLEPQGKEAKIVTADQPIAA